ncbi:putative transmembrane protein [Senna tora]|uniref:Putative transmembrane protein n=1 Tax=Senna tora TaxID=362788 RepID=A0A834THK7_9FABA|nr:putative transmembrane protein [Senna tora]
MEVQSVCCGLPSQPLASKSNHSNFELVHSNSSFRFQRHGSGFPSKRTLSCLKWLIKEPSLLGFNKRTALRASISDADGGLEFHANQSSRVPATTYHGAEPFRGKPGSVSFHGLTHQMVEEGKLVSAPFLEHKGSFFWVLAPIAFISSLILPQFFLANVIETFLKNEILVDIVSSFSIEAVFYVGLATFLHVADRVQRPYLQYSTKRWGLITGLRGYLFSAFITMGLKVIAPLLLVYVTWPVVGLAALVAVAPFLVGCAVQFAFERSLDKRGSSCWPLVPIIFEVYRLYQLTKAVNFVERLMYSMTGLPKSPELVERSGALFAMIVTFQILAVVCLWSLMTFLLRLFPSRPVSEKY